MATGQMSGVLQHFRRAALMHDGGGLSDGQLLERFLARRDEAAFEALVRRHGPMVLGVCRRVLRNEHDAEDAFQATFFVLVRKAASLLPRQGVGNWLYGVAYHTALKARAAAVRRRAREAQVHDMPKRAAPTDDTGQDWRPLLDRELSRLPDRYREPVVLCDLEGKTRKEAARQLGVAEGTLSGRLTTARRKLAGRLARRGVTLPAGALAAVLSQSAASACVPAPLVGSTVEAAALLAAGETAAGVISAEAAALTEGVLKAMWVTKLKMTAAFVVVIGLIALGSGALAHSSLDGATADRPAASPVAAQERPQEPGKRPKEQAKDGATITGSLQAVDADKSSVTVGISNRTDGRTEKTVTVAKDAKILRDGKEVKLADLKTGGRNRVTLKLSPDQKTAVSVSVSGPTTSAPLKSVDADKSTLTITVETRQGKQDKTYPVGKDAKVTVDGKAAKLADLKAGTTYQMTLSAEDGNTLVVIQTPPRRNREREE